MSIKEMSLTAAAVMAILVLSVVLMTATNSNAAGTRIGPETVISYSDLCPENV